jgi:MFS family permease
MLGQSYWLVVGIGFVFTLARFSEAFLLLRAQSVGVSASMIPLVFVLMNIVYSLTAYPVGHLSDRLGRTGLLIIGLAALIASDLTFSFSKTVLQLALGTALWGLHMGFTQGLFAAMIADTATPHLRGTAFGVFNMAGGLAMLMASVIAGLLWDLFGAPATFLVGAIFATMTLGVYVLIRRHLILKTRR